MRWWGWFRKPEPITEPPTGHSRQFTYSRSTVGFLTQDWIEQDAFETLRMKVGVAYGISIDTWTIEFQWQGLDVPDPADTDIVTLWVTAVAPDV